MTTGSLPLSLKGVLVMDGAVVLLQNERSEWELPGGRPETTDADHRETVRREFNEELGIPVNVSPKPVRSWVYEPLPGRHIQIITYSCSCIGPLPKTLTYSDEHSDVGRFRQHDLVELRLPAGYRLDIAADNRLI